MKDFVVNINYKFCGTTSGNNTIYEVDVGGFYLKKLLLLSLEQMRSNCVIMKKMSLRFILQINYFNLNTGCSN